MSRVGKLPIQIPEGVRVKVEDNVVEVEGPKGKLSQKFHPDLRIEVTEKQIVVRNPYDDRFHRSLHGLTRTLIYNMIKGVVDGFRKELEVRGVGYQVELQGRNLMMKLGFSHPVNYKVPEGIEIQVRQISQVIGGVRPVRVEIKGVDKKLVGEVAAQIRAMRPPDLYKGKGIRYIDEIVKHKVGKAAA